MKLFSKSVGPTFYNMMFLITNHNDRVNSQLVVL